MQWPRSACLAGGFGGIRTLLTLLIYIDPEEAVSVPAAENDANSETYEGLDKPRTISLTA